MTTIGGVFEPTSISQREDPRNGIYIKYFALDYWRKSFGYYLVWPAFSVYIVALIVAIIVDCFTVPKMKKKIQERIKLVGQLNEEEERKDKERLPFIEEEKKLNDTLFGKNKLIFTI